MEIHGTVMVYAEKFLFHSVPGTRDSRDLQMLKNLSTFPKQEHFPGGGHSKFSSFENEWMLLLMSGLVGPLASEE